MVGVAITLDLVGLSVAHTTVSTVNESLFVVNKEICGLHVVSMYFRFFFSFFFPVHWLNRVQKGNLNIHPITCLRTGSWSGSASGSGSLPVSQFPCSFCFLGSFYLSLILVFIFLIFGTLDFLRIICPLVGSA